MSEKLLRKISEEEHGELTPLHTPKRTAPGKSKDSSHNKQKRRLVEMKKMISLILTLAMLTTLLAGCSSLTTSPENTGTNTPSSSNSETAEKKVLTVGAQQDPGNLTPWGKTVACRFYINSALYEPLFWINMDKELTPILAKSYENLGNGTYEVTLFDYIYDSNGNQLKASDVVFSLDQYIAEGSNARNVSALESYEATGEYTVQFHFKNDRVGNFEFLATNVYCCTEASFNASPDGMLTTPIGTGRYALKDFVTGSSYTFEKKDTYWQTDEQYICEKNSANVDEIVLKQITDNSTIAIALENGEIDFSENVVIDDRVNFMNSDGTTLDGYIAKEVMTYSLIHLTYNCSENSPLQDINLRKAISYAIDSAAIAENAQSTFGKAATNLVNPNWLDADEDLNEFPGGYYEYNVDTAKEYLAKSNYNGETLRLLVMPNENCNNAALLIQSYCKDIGVKVDLLTYEDALYKELRSEETGLEYDMDLGGIYSSNAYTWKNSAELDINAYKSGVNHCFIYDEKLQNLYDTAASSSTNSKEAANELIQYAADQCYQYALFYYNVVYLGRSDAIEDIIVGPNDAFSLLGAFNVK